MPSSRSIQRVGSDRSSGSPWIRSDRSAIHGRGVYARTAIPAGTRIIQYVGERITKSEARRRENQRLERQRRGGDGCVYVFELNGHFDLDGRMRGNVARLINHSCAPNSRSESIGGRIWIIAQRDIAEGEELTFDYGYGYNEWRLHPCRCGAPGCPGFIVNAAQRWRVRRILRRAEVLKRADERRAAKAAATSVTRNSA
ncbi:MAG: SET domain-containing protein-lysine N-methyltransferase [Opitutus sp.]